ncbi:Uncharacterised protein [Yersinia frederiksenii]|nr:Uncharacterised protein [Yersinia frederiksenii]
MSDLDNFTVEQLTELIESDHAQCGDVSALARMALSAKLAEPEAWIWRGAIGEIWTQEKRKADFVKEHCPELVVTEFYTIPPVNSLVVPEGWKLVPIKPTAEMLASAMECEDVVYDLFDDSVFCVQFDEIYRAMLAAAPQKPSSECK